ncbi:MAG: hypothetical protein RL654_331 [Pseudomonadota bacterium]|jgi:hypothetical protein
MNNNRVLVLLLLEKHLACFEKKPPQRWVHEPIHGEAWYPLPTEGGLPEVLDELDKRFNRSDRLASIEIYLLAAQGEVARLSSIGGDLMRRDCHHWQVLRWEPLRDRAGTLSGALASEPLPSDEWLMGTLLPVLESTLHYRDDTQAAERARVERQHVDTLESLQAERLRLQADLNAMRDQRAALQRPSVEALVTYLPAIYRRVFGIISPSDLALLGGETSVPQIASPWPEPSPDTLLTLQRQIHRLPMLEQDRLRDFCSRLAHKLEARAEMRDWLHSK